MIPMRFALLLLLTAFFPFTAHAVVVQASLPSGISVSADYLKGEPSKPAVLLLHGFLQTRDSPTVARLASGLRDAGYTTLTPTLSLGIPNRMQSLACEAVHKHSMNDDVAEIRHWVAWMKARGHHAIVLLGHSFGSVQLLPYLNANPDPVVKALLGVSLIEVKIGDAPRAPLIAKLQDQVQRKQRTLVSQTLSYCPKYIAPAASLLSYVIWDQPHTLGALKQLPVPAQLVMGGADPNIAPGWLKALQHIQIPVTVVPDANHFMDGEHEFTLLDHALQFLQRLPKTSAR
jgi:pimeloyl-ACP methyl ester carboxylesterase